jgi:hypothetical protein
LPIARLYGRRRLCSGPIESTNVDSCLGCMKAKGHKITQDDVDFCHRHFDDHSLGNPER